MVARRSPRELWAETRAVVKAAATSYSRHGGRMLASAVAFSALLSIAPILYVALGIASVLVGGATSRASVMHDLGRWIGTDGVKEVFDLLDRAHEHIHGGAAAIVGGLVVLYASTRLFSQLKRTLDHLWDIAPRSGSTIKKQLRKRGASLLLVLLVSMLIVVVVAAKTVVFVSTSPLGVTTSHVIFRIGETVSSLVTATLMFAAIFKFLPDARLRWHDAWRGAAVTALLFTLGATAIGFYLGHKPLTVFYGPGGSIVILLLWVYYSAQVFFLGAAITGELARRSGHPIEPDENGLRIAPPQE